MVPPGRLGGRGAALSPYRLERCGLASQPEQRSRKFHSTMGSATSRRASRPNRISTRASANSNVVPGPWPVTRFPSITVRLPAWLWLRSCAAKEGYAVSIRPGARSSKTTFGEAQMAPSSRPDSSWSRISPRSARSLARFSAPGMPPGRAIKSKTSLGLARSPAGD